MKFFAGCYAEQNAAGKTCINYSPYGLVVNEGATSTTPANKFLYQGKEYGDQLGQNIYDFVARQYDPQIGRFSNTDPADQFASGYIGMGCDPANFVDPSGMQASGSQPFAPPPFNSLNNGGQGYVNSMDGMQNAFGFSTKNGDAFIGEMDPAQGIGSLADITTFGGPNSNFELTTTEDGQTGISHTWVTGSQKLSTTMDVNSGELDATYDDRTAHNHFEAFGSLSVSNGNSFMDNARDFANRLDQFFNGHSTYTNPGGEVLTSNNTSSTPGREPKLIPTAIYPSGYTNIDGIMSMMDNKGGSGGFAGVNSAWAPMELLNGLYDDAKQIPGVQKAVDRFSISIDSGSGGYSMPLPPGYDTNRAQQTQDSMNSIYLK